MSEALNATEYLLDRRLEAGDGGRVAINHEGRDWTYDQVAELTAAVAAALHRTGVRPEERVLQVMVDGPEFVATFLGAMRLGAVAVPVSTMLTGAELGFIAADARARVAVISGEFAALAERIAAAAPELTDLVMVGAGTPALPARVRLHRFAEWAVPAPAPPTYATWADSPAFWLYTSGTTGQPKAAMHRHADLPFTAERYGQPVLGIGPQDRCFSVARLFFAYGLGNGLTFPFAVGATSILASAPPTPARVAALVREQRPTLFFAVPSFYAAILAADLPEDTFASVRHGVSAGESLPAPVFHRFRDRFGVEILDGIGSTEVLHIFISNRAGEIRPGTSGRVVEGYEARLVDDDGAAVGDGEPGHLLVRGESVATGYWCRTAVTRRTFEGEWVRTGDVYVRDREQVFTHAGRSDDMLKVGGIWVSPTEVESTLLEHPDVMEAAVVSEPDADQVPQPVAYVVPAPGRTVDPQALIDFCRQRMAAFKRPRRVLVVEALPKTATGKIQRYRLRGG